MEAIKRESTSELDLMGQFLELYNNSDTKEKENIINDALAILSTIRKID